MARGNRESSQTVKATLGLRQLLLDGELLPGERVAELALVERLGVSRTPLRLALQTLEHEGLLETLRGGGFVVRSFTLGDVADAIELRGVLEGTAARFAAERLASADELAELADTTAQLDAIVGADDLDLVAYVSLNDAFHAALLALAKSAALARELERVSALPFAAPRALLATHAYLPESHAIFVVAQYQHRALAVAIAAGHGARAEELAREHARLSHENLQLVLAHGGEILDRLPGAPLLRVP